MIRLAISLVIAIVCTSAGSVVQAEPASVAGITSRTPAEWYAMGGTAMHALAVCSILIVAVCLERVCSLRRRAVVPRRLSESLRRELEVGNRHELKALCESDRSSLGRVARVALEGETARERLEAQGHREAHQIHRNLPFLAALGNLATMLGLLGTVLGMIEAFEMITRSGTGDARIVAGGIFRALITTAAGLGVGITALSAHALLNRRADGFLVELETLATELLDISSPQPSERLDPLRRKDV
jgi:biopolymer transport protein ExbB